MFYILNNFELALLIFDYLKVFYTGFCCLLSLRGAEAERS